MLPQNTASISDRILAFVSSDFLDLNEILKIEMFEESLKSVALATVQSCPGNI